MTIYKQIKTDLNIARKAGRKALAKDLIIILGELARLKGTKVGRDYVTEDPTDEQVLKILNGIIKAEEKTAELTGSGKSSLHTIAEFYLPEMVSEEEIKDFISTIDFSQFKNKMQAVGVVKKHFGSSVDGKMVSDIIKGM